MHLEHTHTHKKSITNKDIYNQASFVGVMGKQFHKAYKNCQLRKTDKWKNRNKTPHQMHDTINYSHSYFSGWCKQKVKKAVPTKQHRTKSRPNHKCCMVAPEQLQERMHI